MGEREKGKERVCECVSLCLCESVCVRERTEGCFFNANSWVVKKVHYSLECCHTQSRKNRKIEESTWLEMKRMDFKHTRHTVKKYFCYF